MIISALGEIYFMNKIYKVDELSFINKICNMYIEFSTDRLTIKTENGKKEGIEFYLPFKKDFDVIISPHSCILEENYYFESLIKEVK